MDGSCSFLAAPCPPIVRRTHCRSLRGAVLTKAWWPQSLRFPYSSVLSASRLSDCIGSGTAEQREDDCQPHTGRYSSPRGRVAETVSVTVRQPAMKTTLGMVAILALTGCATSERPVVPPEFANLNRFFYARYDSVQTPTFESDDTFMLTIWLPRDEPASMQFFMGPKVISSVLGTNQVFTDVEFHCEVPADAMHEFYAKLTSGLLQSLPGVLAQQPDARRRPHQGEPPSILSLDVRSHELGPSWFVPGPQVAPEWKTLHKEISSFIRARIRECPEALRIRQIHVQEGQWYSSGKGVDVEHPPAN